MAIGRLSMATDEKNIKFIYFLFITYQQTHHHLLTTISIMASVIFTSSQYSVCAYTEISF